MRAPSDNPPPEHSDRPAGDLPPQHTRDTTVPSSELPSSETSLDGASSDQESDVDSPEAESTGSAGYSRPQGSRNWMLPVAIVATLFVWLAVFRSPPPTHDAVGGPAPEVDLVRLDDDLDLPPVTPPRDQVVLLHFWGTWCPPCQQEYPHLVKMASRYADSDGFRFLPVTCEAQPDTFDNLWAETTGYFRRNGIESPAYADPRGLTRRSTAERLDQPSLYYPTSVLIDAQGNIAGVWEGYTPGTVDEIETTLREMLDR